MKTYLKYILGGLMLIGIFNAVRVSMLASEVPATAEPVVEPAKVSFTGRFIAGSGMIEPKSELIEIASPVAGLVTDVFVKVGQTVKRGDPLFQIDPRSRQAELIAAQAASVVAQAKFEEATNLFNIVESARARDFQAVSKDQYETRKGALHVVKAQLEKAKADEEYIRAELERLTVKSPIDAMILQSRVRAGEFAASSGLNKQDAIMIIGDVSDLHIRVDIDENDAWRFKPDGKAQGYIRGNPQLKLDLEFVNTEPYVIPKRSLNGGTTERVDTRVLQVIYRIIKSDSAPFVGQLVDVSVESN